MNLVGELFESALDIAGDVHGEIGALARLLDRLGDDSHGNHADGRRLVFLGDLTDRGPDSPAVLEHVARLLGSGRAQCIAGHHEINLMRGEKKHGNDWWVWPQLGSPLCALPVCLGTNDRPGAFLGTLPLAAVQVPEKEVTHDGCETWSIGSMG